MFFCGNENANHHLRTGFSIHQGIRLAVKRITFINDRMSYMILRGHWYDIVLSVHALRIKMLIQRIAFYEELKDVFDQFM
jgi:hypothetical protein